MPLLWDREDLINNSQNIASPYSLFIIMNNVKESFPLEDLFSLICNTNTASFICTYVLMKNYIRGDNQNLSFTTSFSPVGFLCVHFISFLLKAYVDVINQALNISICVILESLKVPHITRGGPNFHSLYLIHILRLVFSFCSSKSVLKRR